MTLSRLALYSSGAFVGGVFVSSFVDFHLPAFLLLAALMLYLLCFGGKKGIALTLLILFLGFGIWRGDGAEKMPVGWSVAAREVSFTGRVVAEPDLRENELRVEVQPDFAPVGRVLVFTSRFREIGYGDTLELSGRLERPESFDGFDYPSYLQSKGVYGLMFRPSVRVAAQGSGLLSPLFLFKDRLRQEGLRHLSPESSSLLSAMVLGDKDRMPDSLKERLSEAGVRHITAVSGMHVAILSALSLSFLLRLGMWRRQALLFSLFVIVLFVIFSGLQPSAIRAGIMGSMFLFGQMLNRRSASFRALVFAASAMLLLNPLLLVHDVSFQLSFLAVLGIIAFAPFFTSFFKFLPPFFSELAALSASAQLLTLPLVAHSFGAVSVTSFAANLVLVPLVPFVFGFGIIFYAFSLVAFHLGALIAFPLSLILSAFSFTVNLASSIPLLKTEHVPAALVLSLYAVIGLVWMRFLKPKEFFLTHPFGTISEW
ncbi:MAG: ComEC/Rec2 family competence protein [bacterium]|nr:ComEC/Rec2 family competence protein [bacterium]